MTRSLKHITLLFIILCLLSVATYATIKADGLWSRSSGIQVESIERAIHEAALQCYALEGYYPEDLEYLSEHYGILLDEVHYQYHYQYVGGNIRPEIKVVRR